MLTSAAEAWVKAAHDSTLTGFSLPIKNVCTQQRSFGVPKENHQDG